MMMMITVCNSTGHEVQLVFITTFFHYPFYIPFDFIKNLSCLWFFMLWGYPILYL